PKYRTVLIEGSNLAQEMPRFTPRKLDPRIDRDLETICLKCLDKEAAKRYRRQQLGRGFPLLSRESQTGWPLLLTSQPDCQLGLIANVSGRCHNNLRQTRPGLGGTTAAAPTARAPLACFSCSRARRRCSLASAALSYRENPC